MTKIFLPMGYPWYTPRVVSLVLSCQDWLPRDHFWDFSWFFLNFPGFFQFFTNFYPKICRPPSAAENFFRPWVVDPYLNFFTHSTKTTQGCYPTLFFYPRYSTKKNFLPWVHTPPTPPFAHVWLLPNVALNNTSNNNSLNRAKPLTISNIHTNWSRLKCIN